VDESTNEMSSRIKQLEKDVRLLEEAANSAKMLRNKAAYVVRELEMFDEAYLSLED
jgi:mitofusin